MKHSLISFIVILMAMTSIAQNDENSYRINTTTGDLTIHPVLHASMVIKWNEIVIYVDPYGGAELYESFEPGHLVLITDFHPDHYDQATLEAIKIHEAQFVAPKVVFDMMPENWQARTQLMVNGDMAQFFGLEITAVPMYNTHEDKLAFHEKGRGNGYVLMAGEKRIYISGDTEDIPEMADLDEIAVAMICMNEPYTMSMEQAANAVSQIKPEVVIPFHFRNGDKTLNDVSEFKKMVDASEVGQKTEVVLLKWYPKPD